LTKESDEDMRFLRAEDCADLQPRMFLVHHAAGETLAPQVGKMLDPIDTDSICCFFLPKDRSTELHYHDFDEYWAWVHGRTVVTIRLPDGRSGQFEIGPGWVVYCVRGVEHAHQPLGDWGCFQWTSIRRAGAREGHLTRRL
jgi:mannose-6-phosphate isomerase-like protein (cupin superfamily)